MRNRPRPKGSINAFTKYFNKYVIKSHVKKHYLGLIEVCTIDNTVDISTTIYSFNLEDDGC